MTSATDGYAPYLTRHLAAGERLLAACPTRIPQGRTFSGSRATGAWRANADWLVSTSKAFTLRILA